MKTSNHKSRTRELVKSGHKVTSRMERRAEERKAKKAEFRKRMDERKKAGLVTTRFSF